MTRTDDHIRSFGMSGYLLSEELNEIERLYSVELGHGSNPEGQDPTEYYPQFEQTVRTEADLMSRHYRVFYCLEQSIRKLITETLEETEGANWWNAGRIPPEIIKDVAGRIQKELDSGVTQRSEDPIDYTTFGELSVVITTNWELFGTIFTSRRAVERVMSNLNTLRGPIAHCCPISEDEALRLNLTVKDWFRMIG